MSENDPRAAFREALANYAAAARRLREASWLLPELPDDERAEGEFHEAGYHRQESWDREPVTDDDDNVVGYEDVHACSRGWSAMSDEGEAQWLEVDGLEFRVPDDMDWD